MSDGRNNIMKPTRVLLSYPIPSVSSPQKSPALSIFHVGESIRRYPEYEVRYHDARWDTDVDLLGGIEWADVVGVSSMTGHQLKGAIKTLKLAKQYGKRTILGGIHSSMQSDQCLAEDYVDSVVIGEGETAILDAINGGHKAKIVAHNLRTEEMVSPVSQHTMRYFKYSAYTGDTMLLASRGCPYRCSFCLDGDTPVMMADLSWKKIKDINEGDEIVGLEKKIYGHSITRTQVIATMKREAQTYRIDTDKGSVIATGDHRWLSHSNHSRWRDTNRLRSGDKIRWVTFPTEEFVESNDYKIGYLSGAIVGDGYTGHYKYGNQPMQNKFGLVGDYEMLDTFKMYASELGIGVTEGKFNGGKIFKNVTRIVRTQVRETVERLESMVDTPNPSEEYMIGFLSGFYDADGGCYENAVRFFNKDDGVLGRVFDYLSKFGFSVTFEKNDYCNSLLLLGGQSEKLRLFSIIRPKVSHKANVFNVGLGNGFATVVSVTPLDGKRDVYDIQTGTENFVANGLVSHNCYIVPFFHNKKGEIRWAKVDLDQWKQDIITLKKHTGLTRMAHGDDWAGPEDRLFDILEFLKSQGIQYWPSIRAHQITNDVARRLKELGVEHVSVGIETASPRILKLVDKGNDLDDLKMCVRALSSSGLHPLLYYISGFPTETQQEINESLDFADWTYDQFKGNVTQNFYAFTPLPGNPLWNLVDKTALPKTMEEWSNFSLNQTYNKQASNLYHIAGLTFHRSKGDKTDRNFPHFYRLLIAPFELLAIARWKFRFFSFFEVEKYFIDLLLKWASRRYENEVGTVVGKSDEVDIMDWGVSENRPDVGARGEFLTGEIGNE